MSKKYNSDNDQKKAVLTRIKLGKNVNRIDQILITEIGGVTRIIRIDVIFVFISSSFFY